MTTMVIEKSTYPVKSVGRRFNGSIQDENREGQTLPASLHMRCSYSTRALDGSSNAAFHHPAFNPDEHRRYSASLSPGDDTKLDCISTLLWRSSLMVTNIDISFELGGMIFLPTWGFTTQPSARGKYILKKCSRRHSIHLCQRNLLIVDWGIGMWRSPLLRAPMPIIFRAPYGILCR